MLEKQNPDGESLRVFYCLMKVKNRQRALGRHCAKSS
jgi:hypothetical protein